MLNVAGQNTPLNVIGIGIECVCGILLNIIYYGVILRFSGEEHGEDLESYSLLDASHIGGEILETEGTQEDGIVLNGGMSSQLMSAIG